MIQKEYKISFTGDIMCEEPLLKAARTSSNQFDFHPVFSKTKNLFADSDLVIGNLETVLAGYESGYTDDLFLFNTPDSFAQSIKAGGIDFVTFATNHTLDKGIQGLKHTIEVLETNKIDYVGAYKSESDSQKIKVVEFGNNRVAILNYTYGSNVNENGCYLSDSERFHLNIMKPIFYIQGNYKNSLTKMKAKLLRRSFKMKTILKIKKLLGKDYKNIKADKLNIQELDQTYLDKITNDVKKAKNASDVVIVCLHAGGQFNDKPGESVEYYTKFFSELNVDLVVGNHPHVVHPFSVKDQTYIANSLGNYSISPSSIYVPSNKFAEYSILFHVYFTNKKISRMTFSILKIVENKNGMLTVYPVDELYQQSDENERKNLNKDVISVYSRFTNQQNTNIDIQREYEIKGINYENMFFSSL